MDEAFACPECGTIVEVQGLAPGRQVRCGFCQRLLEVPYMPRVAEAAWKRRRFGRPRWVPWAWSAPAVLGVLIVLIAAGRFVISRESAALVRKIDLLIASSENHEARGSLGQALIDMDAAINLSSQDSADRSESVRTLKSRRQILARRDARAVLDRLSQDEAPSFPLGDWLNLEARIAKDPDLAPLKETMYGKFALSLNRELATDLAKARRLFESGEADKALEICDAVTRLLPHVSSTAQHQVRTEAEALVKQIVSRNGIVVDPLRGQFLSGSVAKYQASMIPELIRTLKAKHYLPQPDLSAWRDLWQAAPYRLVVDLNERLVGNYMSSENRLTHIDAHLRLSYQGQEIWQATPAARTAVPLPNLPAYQAARVAMSLARSEEFERLLYDDARGAIDGKFAFALRNMPDCRPETASPPR
jgi:hypothetical protein